MADRVSASICIGGALPRELLDEFITRIEAEGLVDSLGEYFRADHITGTEPLELFANDVPWGRFDDLEAFCIENGLRFSRWCGSCPGAWEAERVVFDRTSEPRSYTVTENDVTVVTAAEVRNLGSFDAILAYLASAKPDVPPFTLTDPGR